NSTAFTIQDILVTPVVPTIATTAPTCLADGFSEISNYDGALTYVFTPAGPSVDAAGLISGMMLNTMYEVTASNATCTSAASAQFSNLPMLVTPVVPVVSETAPTCLVAGFANITNYDTALTYVFTPVGPTVDGTGLISGMTFGTSYEVAANNGSCSSVNSAAFTIQDILVTPVVPTIATTAPTCLADGFSEISNYDGALTYVFTPTGPTVDALGLISGMTLNTLYEVTASNATCTSTVSVQFSNLPMLVTPVVPVVSETSPTCLAAGFATITNYVAGTTYDFTPVGPTVDGTGLISGMTFGTSYEVAANNGSCSSVNSAAFTISPILPQPTIVSITNNGPICLGGTAIFTINATPNTQVTYSVNGNPTQTVAINASGVGVVNVAGATGTTTINTVSVFDGICSSNLVLSSVVNLFANTTISLISTSGTDSQSRCAGVTIDPIQYQVTGTATGVVVTGLPAGVTYDYNVATGLVTISGAANVGGVYNYSITTSGGCNPQASASGSITITGLPVLSYSVTNTICDGSTLDFVLNSSLPNTTYSWSATVSNITGSYSTTTNGDETNINQIATLTNAENIGTITMIIVPMANGCYGAASSPIIITVNPIPVVESVSVADSSVCSATNATNNVHVDIVGNISGITYTWTAITSGVTVVGGTTSGTITAASTTTSIDLQVITSNPLVAGTIYFEVSSVRNGCVGNTLSSGVVTVNPNPGLPIPSPIKTICSENSTDLRVDVSPLILGTELTWEVLTVVNVTGANPGTGIAPVTINDILTATTNTQGYVIYRVRSTLGDCQGGYTDYRVNVNPSPQPVLTDGNICITASGEVYQTYTLNTGLNDVDYDFEWFDSAGNIIPGATNSTLVVDEAGTYSVIATNWLTGCSSDPLLPSATAVVTETTPATTMTIVQSEYFSDNATITITVPDGTGTLLYQLDEGSFQSSNVFTGVSAGEHTVTVIDSEGCTYMTEVVMIIDYPNYFTPNGDGINDTWNITGLNQADAKLYIFDRYGKLLKQLSATDDSEGWDGTYNQELLPSTDYWFSLDYTENGVAKQFKAHFSMKR
uniref:T9SS type B sorting domain-containing protein n=1 Tax=Flavobacterium sp. TaxID=239 RepID=UPI004047D196